MVSRNNYSRVDYDYYAKTLHPSAHRNMVPRVILLKFGLTPLNTARPVYTPQPKPTVYSARSMSHFSKQAQSTDQRPFYKKTTLTNRYFHQKVNIVMRHYYTVRPRAVNTARPYTAPVNAVRAKRVIGKPQMDDKGFVDSGCSRHMTGNIAYLSDFKEFDGGYVTFRGGTHGGRISGKGTLKTDCLDFEDVYFVNELKFNLFSVSQMCDKKNYVLFTNTECLVLSPNFKLTDESQILLKIPRKDNMYCFDMKNIVPKENLTCLVAKATLDESMLWHRRLGHINFKNINKLVKENLVRGLPLKHFENDQTSFPRLSVGCLKGKQDRASLAACTISNESASTQGDLNAGCGNDEPKSAADDIRQVKDGPHNESDDKDNPEVNTGRFEFNTVDPLVNIASSYDLHSLKDMFKVGASHTLEATHVEFFSDKDEPEVNLGNIPNSYIVPTTPNTRIHKDHPIKNVIGDVKSFVQIRRMTRSTSAQGFLSAVYEEKTHDTLNTYVKFASTPVDLEKPLVKDGDIDDVDVHIYRSMIRFQVTPKTSHLLAIKRIFRYLKGKPTLGLWYSRDSPFELVAYTDSDYAGATQDRKSTTGGYLLTKGFDARRFQYLVSSIGMLNP
ncbi:ribonuclease H-like domain-containing protein [Tanacetum coccineum]|uniref:Ribonuclease H-like domain-containing protein n=1 Tax=Tanacetum coccineum TaxID=301880 RepID=A0ABQ4Z367_9ASTR